MHQHAFAAGNLPPAMKFRGNHRAPGSHASN